MKNSGFNSQDSRSTPLSTPDRRRLPRKQSPDQGTHPELIELRLLGIVGALVRVCAAELVAAADVNCPAAGGLVLRLDADEASVDLLLRLGVNELDLAGGGGGGRS